MQNVRAVALVALTLLTASAQAAEHPRVLYGAADIPALREKATSTHGAIAASLRQGTDDFVGASISTGGDVNWPGRSFNLGDRRDIGSALVVWSFTWQVQGDAKYLDHARSWLMTVASWGSWDLDGERDLLQGHILYGAAFAYDVLYPQLSEAQRTTVRNAITREANALMRAGQGGLWWERDYLQNHNWINHAAVGFAGLALQGEAPQASVDAWIGYATENARHVKTVLDSISDGTWHEGVSYLAYGLIWHLPFVEGLRRAGGEDLTDLKLVRGLGPAILHMQLPERTNQYVLPFGDFSGWNDDGHLFPLRYAASRYRSGAAQLAADRWSARAKRFTYGPELAQQAFEFLAYDPAVAGSAATAAEPLDWYARDLQAVVFRNGWGDGSLLFGMKSAPYGGKSVLEQMQAGVPEFATVNFAHDHADDNGFYLYGGGAWLAPEAQGYFIGHPESPGPQANRTIFHNTLLVDGQGQLGEGVRSSSDSSSRYSWFRTRKGGIPFQASTANNAYAVAEGASLYPDSMGLTRFDRHALFLDRRFVVLRDVVSATAARDFGWVVHAMDGSSREGSWLRNASKDGQVLGVAVVSPASFGVSTASQSPVHLDKLDSDGSVTAITVTPSTPARDVTFLTALVPTTSAGWSSRPKVNALDASQPDAGLEVVDGARTSRAIFAAPGTARSAGGLALEGLAGAVSLQDGEPTRALLVRGRSLAAGSRTLLAVDGSTDALEADGLGADTVVLTGQVDGAISVWAPRATRALLNGREVTMSRAGETVQLSTAGAPPLAGDPATAPSAPAVGAVASGDAQRPAGRNGASGDSIGPPGAVSAVVPAHGGCSGGGEASAIALLGVVALTARAVRRGQRGRVVAPPPGGGDLDVARAA